MTRKLCSFSALVIALATPAIEATPSIEATPLTRAVLALPAQSTGTKQQPAQQPPDETNPPEEDASVAPKVYAFNPLEAQRCISIGNFYMRKGNKGYRAALGRYEDATKYDPNSAEAFFKVGEVEEKLNNKDAAKIAFEKAIKLAPDSKFAREAKKKLAGLS